MTGALVRLGLVSMLLASAASGPRYSSRIVSTQAGHIRGIILESSDWERWEPVEAFLGVPYGFADRWEEANRPQPWRGTRLADTFAPVCLQDIPDISNRTEALSRMTAHRYRFIKTLMPLLANQSEDCLHLNIYVPGSGATGIEAPYAVVIYVHGESFMWNSGNPYDGRVLASFGHVIFISVNYRLGALGFLKVKSGREVPLAVMDIVTALRWTKENIASFGGDPSRVIIVGHHTGASVVNLLLLQPIAKGLFKGVCLLSGSSLSPWGIVAEPTMAREEVSRRLGCPPGLQAIPCLRSLPMQAFAGMGLKPPRFLPFLGPWTAPMEPQAAVQQAGEPFLSTRLLLSATTTESVHDFNDQDVEYGIEEDQRNRILRTFVRNAYLYHLNEIFSTIRNEYTDWERAVQHPINVRDSTMEALSDGHTVAPLLRLAYLHARRGSPTYFLHFGHQTKEAHYPQRLGSTRGEDVLYFLGLPLIQGRPYFPHNYSTQDIRVAETAVTILTNFAKSGDPNEPKRVELHGPVPSQPPGKNRHPIWDMYQPTTQLYLSLSAKTRMKSHYRGHKMSVWLNLIPQLHQPGESDVSMRHHHFHERASHFYAGGVREEWFTRSPAVATTVGEPPLCPPNGSEPAGLGLSELPTSSPEDDDEAHYLRNHYYSTSTALGVTVGLGSLLVLLNILAFSAIYYQRNKQKAKRKPRQEVEEAPPPPSKPRPPTPPLRTSSNLSVPLPIPVPIPVTPATPPPVTQHPMPVTPIINIQEISV